MEEQTHTIQEIQGKLRPIFARYPVYKATLFGSYARGDAIYNSDIDIAVDSRGEIMNLSYFGLLEDITVTMNADIDLLDMTQIEQDSPICQSITQQGVTLYEKKG